MKTLLTQTSVVFNWPFGSTGRWQARGKDVRDFEPVGPFRIKSFSETEWFVADSRLVNHYGCVLPGQQFTSRKAVEEFLRKNLGG